MPEENQNFNNVSEPEINELKETLAAAEKARDEYLAGWQRAKADFINYKQDERKHFDDAVRYGIEGIVRDMIGVLDSFDLAMRAIEKTDKAEKGLYLIKLQIEDILKKRGVLKIPVKLGDPFDPVTMEAMSEIESEQPPGTVAEEIEPGYRLYDKILRASRVIVNKGKSN
jgi:molecular chaperone GrpE